MANGIYYFNAKFFNDVYMDFLELLDKEISVYYGKEKVGTIIEYIYDQGLSKVKVRIDDDDRFKDLRSNTSVDSTEILYIKDTGSAYIFTFAKDVPDHIKENISKNSIVSLNEKRTDYISWEEYFMEIANVSAKRSKDPVKQVGACIVRDNKILSIGYNGFPNGCSDDEFPWGKHNPSELENKHFYVVHAELNAILNYKGDLTGSTIYVTLFPCCECAKAIIQSGIKEVVYVEDKVNLKTLASRRMFKSSGIKVREYKKL